MDWSYSTPTWPTWDKTNSKLTNKHRVRNKTVICNTEYIKYGTKMFINCNLVNVISNKTLQRLKYFAYTVILLNIFC